MRVIIALLTWTGQTKFKFVFRLVKAREWGKINFYGYF